MDCPRNRSDLFQLLPICREEKNGGVVSLSKRPIHTILLKKENPPVQPQASLQFHVRYLHVWVAENDQLCAGVNIVPFDEGQVHSSDTLQPSEAGAPLPVLSVPHLEHLLQLGLLSAHREHRDSSTPTCRQCIGNQWAIWAI